MAHIVGEKGTDAQLTNASRTKVSKVYSDLDLFFAKKNSNSDVNIIEDVQAVKRSIRSLVLLNPFEKPFHPEIGSGVRDMLFENMTPITGVVLARKIEDVIRNFEPRARLQAVRCTPDYDRNAYTVTVDFYVRNTPTQLVEMDLFLERLR
jgi:phage baseplate assembly protein W|tara:strand:+ start:378 stop:827 length:450 start_codon:yes stop_codon:yes gene_type:complete